MLNGDFLNGLFFLIAVSWRGNGWRIPAQGYLLVKWCGEIFAALHLQSSSHAPVTVLRTKRKLFSKNWSSKSMLHFFPEFLTSVGLGSTGGKWGKNHISVVNILHYKWSECHGASDDFFCFLLLPQLKELGTIVPAVTGLLASQCQVYN